MVKALALMLTNRGHDVLLWSCIAESRINHDDIETDPS